MGRADEIRGLEEQLDAVRRKREREGVGEARDGPSRV